MQSIRRAPTGLRQGLRSINRQQPRRWAHDAHDAHHAHAGPSEESLGTGFYVTVAMIPAGYLLYKLSASKGDDQPAFTRFINSFDSWKEDWKNRNDLHTKAVEQAGRDRNLFLNSPGTRHVELKFPETINGGSPWNVPAGHGNANIDHAIAKYQKENYEEQRVKLEALKSNNIRAEKPYEAPIGSHGH